MQSKSLVFFLSIILANKAARCHSCEEPALSEAEWAGIQKKKWIPCKTWNGKDIIPIYHLKLFQV